MLRKVVVSAGIAFGLAFATTVPAAAIVGGSPAATDTAPYQVSVLMEGWVGKSHACGGFLIGAKRVVTSAHCIAGATASKIEVRWGGLEKGKLPHSSGVSKVVVHPGWNANTFANDVGILQLSGSASETGTVRFAKLASSAPAPDTLATVTGWGRTQADDPSLPNALQETQLPIRTFAACQAAYPGPQTAPTSPDPVLGSGMLCAGSDDGGSGICTLDSGDPLTADGMVVGIASWSRGCGEPGSPSVFTDVAQVKSWAESQ
ncbi:S1 family serine peptidase [Streptomyces alanosinicus]|uniref:Serine protease n=1 Tax=Streptomyces alanosinicus TaxID=68171 RepID=A0A918YRD5_9ACTN|nr:serine protease [Streptomyces alanosinicus]GHE12956.1 serine protease [Streptomyces alanosinicus]